MFTSPAAAATQALIHAFMTLQKKIAGQSLTGQIAASSRRRRAERVFRAAIRRATSSPSNPDVWKAPVFTRAS
jgi:hypothetical protein